MRIKFGSKVGARVWNANNKSGVKEEAEKGNMESRGKKTCYKTKSLLHHPPNSFILVLPSLLEVRRRGALRPLRWLGSSSIGHGGLSRDGVALLNGLWLHLYLLWLQLLRLGCDVDHLVLLCCCSRWTRIHVRGQLYEKDNRNNHLEDPKHKLLAC